jgi:8-oxo-dGTP pyrophosphatase MutT (NUDIX family)
MRYGDIAHGSSKALIWSRSDDSYLLVLRSTLVSSALQWDMPGGHVEAGETAAQALRRELKQELDWDLARWPVTRLSSLITQQPRFETVVYAVCVPHAFEPRLDWENVDWRWFRLDGLPTELTTTVNLLLSNDSAAEALKTWQAQWRVAGKNS